ncbi:MAG: metal ABC transporter substrate-binding protein [Clostridia bacterium]|nr:metal ABC transporter substrate-binding protein [Clostridia bacterium]
MKRLLLILLLSLVTIIMAGCSSNKAVSEKPQIYTSFYALYDFTKEIAGNNADVYNIVPAGTEPHDWEPTVQDMAKLNDGDILFYNGLGMESWIDKVKSSLEGSNVSFVELSLGAAVDENGTDPHIWLDPNNVKIMCKTILDSLCEIDPDNKTVYELNYNNYTAALDSLDKSYREAISALPNKSIVVSHEAYSYLCNAYGLKQTSINGISADSEPSPDKMKDLINFVKENNIKYIFYEELVTQKTAEILSQETGAKLLPLNPFEGLTNEEMEKGENYISIMYKNLENIKTALS